MLIAAGLVAFAGWSLVRIIKSPAEGVINPMTLETTGAVAAQNYTRYDAGQASFVYPANYRIDKGQDLPANVLASYSFVSPRQPGRPTKIIAVTIYKLPGTDLTENSAYKIRQDSPQIYAKSIEQVSGQSFTVFKKTDGTEAAVFTQHGSWLAAIGLSGALSNSLDDDDYKAVVNSWLWK